MQRLWCVFQQRLRKRTRYGQVYKGPLHEPKCVFLEIGMLLWPGGSTQEVPVYYGGPCPSSIDAMEPSVLPSQE